ncbi:hypothetical protein HDU81_004237 [Chytriomyces hyalinus]|nr:hypothetical protein HDU81_004237 [Chytriomyces hyalinus]
MAARSARSNDAESSQLRSAQEQHSPSAVGISERRIQYYFQKSTIPRLGTQRPPPNCRWRLESNHHQLETQFSNASEFVVDDDGTGADDYVEGDAFDADDVRQRSFAVRTVTFSEDSIPTFGLVPSDPLKSQQETGDISDDEDAASVNGQKDQLELEGDTLASDAFPPSAFEQSETSSKCDAAGQSTSFKTNSPTKSPVLRIKTGSGSGSDARQIGSSHQKSMPSSAESEARGRSQQTEPRSRGYASPTMASYSKSPISQKSASSAGPKRVVKSNVSTPTSRNASKEVARSASADYSSQDEHAGLGSTRVKGYAAPTASSSRRIASDQNSSRLQLSTNQMSAQNSKAHVQGPATALASPKTPPPNSTRQKSASTISESEKLNKLKLGQGSTKLTPGDTQPASPRRAGYNAPTLSSSRRVSSNQPAADSVISPRKNNSRERTPTQAVKASLHPRNSSSSPKSQFGSLTDGAPVLAKSEAASSSTHAIPPAATSNRKRSESCSAATKASSAKKAEAREPSPDRTTAESQQKRFERVVKRQLSVPLKSADQLGPSKNDSPKESLFPEGSRHVFTSHDGIITPASLRSRQSTDQSQASFLHEMKQFGQTISGLALQDAFDGASASTRSVPQKEGYSAQPKEKELLIETAVDAEKEHESEKSPPEEPKSRGSFSSADEAQQTRSFELPDFYVEECAGKSFLADRMSTESSLPQLPMKIESLHGSIIDISSSNGSTPNVSDGRISLNAATRHSKLNPNVRPKRDNHITNPAKVSMDFDQFNADSEENSARTPISAQKETQANDPAPVGNLDSTTQTNSPSSNASTDARKTELHMHLSRKLKGLNSLRNKSESSLADLIEHTHESVSDIDNTGTTIRRNSKSNPDFLSAQPNATLKVPNKVVPAPTRPDTQQTPLDPSPVSTIKVPSPSASPSQRDFLCGFHKESLNLLLKTERPSRLPLPTGSNGPRSTRSQSFSATTTTPSTYPKTISRIRQTNGKPENSNGITLLFNNMNQVSADIQTLTNKAKLHIFTTVPRTRSKMNSATATKPTESPFLDTTPVEGYLKAAATTRHGRSPSGNGRETQFSIRPTISRSPFSATALLPTAHGATSSPSKP